MISSKTTEILKTLSENELKEFEKFIKSPFFNRGRNLLPYYKAILKFYPSFTDPGFKKEYLFKTLYPRNNYDKKKSESILSTLSSDLLRILEYFLIFKNIEREKIKKHLLLNYELYARDLNELINKNVDKMFSELDSRGIDENYFLYKHLFYFLLNDVNVKLRNKEKVLEYEEEGAKNLFLYFFQDLLKRFSVFNVRKKEFYGLIANEPIYLFLRENLEIEKLIDRLKNSNADFEKIEAYYWWMKSHENYGNMKIYDKFRTSVFTDLHKFSHLEKFNLLTNLMAFLNISERMGFGNLKVRKLDIVNKMTEKNIYNDINNSLINERIYLYILDTYLESGKMNEAEDFIKTHSIKLLEQIRQDGVNQSFALLNFYKKNYNKSLIYLSKISNRKFNINSGLKILEIMCLFETNELNQLDYVMKAAQKHYRKNKTLSDTLISIHKEFIGILEKVIKFSQNNFDRADLMKIKEDVNSPKYIYKKNWLSKKIEELENHKLKTPSLKRGYK